MGFEWVKTLSSSVGVLFCCLRYPAQNAPTIFAAHFSLKKYVEKVKFFLHTFLETV